jgi:flavin reductase (DIM6/NTAB) family NADH-FMN oxidoreductase RutF
MDETAKKSILRQIPYGLYVIGVKDGAAHHAFTGSFLSQCSIKPPCLMLGVKNGTHSLEMIRQGKAFSVNWLAKEDKKVLEQFFKPTPSSGNRFGELGYQLKNTGTPILDKAISFVECELRSIQDAGDHSVVIGEVVNAGIVREGAPLVMGDTPWHYGG